MYHMDARLEARKLLEELGLDDTEGRVPLSRIAERLKAKFEYIDSEEIEGVCLRAGEESLIRVKRGANKCRFRFTVSHELAHLALDHGMAFFWGKSLTCDKRAEAKANAWASEILMPIKPIRRLAKNYCIAEMAHIFGVSQEAMYYRLKNLGLLNKEPLSA